MCVVPDSEPTSPWSAGELILDYPEGDIILRSRESYRLRVPKIFITHSSPVLRELIRKALDPFCDAETSLPVVQLPESGEILHYLLTFILPLSPSIPSNDESIIELLSVAQKYQMETALGHIRERFARQDLPTRLQPALRMYSLAQKYGLRQEALRFARAILKHSISMTIEDLKDRDMLDIMPGASLHELWTYYERVRATLASDLTEFIKSDGCGILTHSCPEPGWVHQYIMSIGNAPHLFDPFELNIAMARHIFNVRCKCGDYISSEIIHEFWEALVSVVNGSFEKVSVIICGAAQDIESFTGRVRSIPCTGTGGICSPN